MLRTDPACIEFATKWKLNTESQELLARLTDAVDPKLVTSDDRLVIAALEYGSNVLFGRCFDPMGDFKLYQGWPIMWWAAYFNRADRTKLAASLAAATYIDEFGRSILHWVSCWNQNADDYWLAECVRLTMSACGTPANCEMLLNARDNSGCTPFQTAVE